MCVHAWEHNAPTIHNVHVLGPVSIHDRGGLGSCVEEAIDLCAVNSVVFCSSGWVVFISNNCVVVCLNNCVMFCLDNLVMFRSWHGVSMVMSIHNVLMV